MTVPSTERLGDHELEWIRENAAELNQGSYGPQAAQAAEALLRVLNELDRRKAAFTEELRDLLRKHDAKVDGLERVLESTRERRDDYSRKLIGWREAAEKAAAERDALQGQLDKAREDLDALEPIAAPHRMTADQRERYRRHASWEGAEHFMKQAEAAARRWQREADWLREFRDERKAETEAGTWPLPGDFDCCERHPARALGLGGEASDE